MSFVREEEGPLGNPSFLTLSLSCFLLFSSSNPLFLTLSLSCFLLFSLFFFSVSSSSPPSSSSSFRTTAPPFVVTPPWSSARPTRPDFVFFYHPFILLGCANAYSMPFVFLLLLPALVSLQCPCPCCCHHLPLSHGSFVPVSSSLMALRPYHVRFLGSFFSFFFVFLVTILYLFRCCLVQRPFCVFLLFFSSDP